MMREKRRVIFSSEVRRAAEGRTIAGLASVFDSVYPVGGMFYEVIRSGAFNKSLADGGDLFVLWQHRDDAPLGTRAAGTAKFWVDEKGLHYECQAPNTTFGNDALESIGRRDVRGSSICFLPVKGKETWTRDYRDGKPLRELSEVVLEHVSPVTFPASPTTSTEARAEMGEAEAGEIVRLGLGGDGITQEPGARNANHSGAERSRLILMHEHLILGGGF